MPHAFVHALVPVDPLVVDGAQLGAAALARAVGVAGSITLISVVSPPVDHDHPDFSGAIEPALRDARAKELTRDEELLSQIADSRTGVKTLCIWDLHRSVADQICGAATTLGADLIVIPSHGKRGIVRLVLGSVAESVMKNAPVAVLLLRPDQETR